MRTLRSLGPLSHCVPSPTTAVSCTLCPAGYMCDDPAASPQPCAVGYYSTGGASICEACTPGYRCPEASASPTPVGSQCPEGTYCNPARTLIKCPEGTFGKTHFLLLCVMLNQDDYPPTQRHRLAVKFPLGAVAQPRLDAPSSIAFFVHAP